MVVDGRLGVEVGDIFISLLDKMHVNYVTKSFQVC